MDAFDEPTTQVLKPDNQLQLTEKELEEEITKQLTANNPNAPSNIARYSMKERTFKFEPMVEQLVMHYATDGYLLHQESDEAKRQVALEEMEAQAMAEWVPPAASPRRRRKGRKAPKVPKRVPMEMLRVPRRRTPGRSLTTTRSSFATSSTLPSARRRR